jgi:predicted RNA-binding protein with PIN domain
MRLLIDGYNVMHAGGWLGSKLSRQGFRHARRRFLDELAGALGAELAPEAMVVFDATVPPGDFGVDEKYRSISVVFALGDENADARIEQLIAKNSNPKTLTVVSSDRRVRRAAARRRAHSLTADEFWVKVDKLKERKAARPPADARPTPSRASPQRRSTPEETAFWLEAFGGVTEVEEIGQALASGDSMLTDAEIAELKREIERET